ncbi:hypothetical protein Vafri_6744 [Volvox africanus]|uniref:Alpha-aminoacylpeptide hydrolase n=1 Tax=Volvox africanus TaxID=51714 RepID=A0A8J4AYT6_9CHLO|nr:hypothetical protein Vafri_6744 [Volvox africanus]
MALLLIPSIHAAQPASFPFCKCARKNSAYTLDKSVKYKGNNTYCFKVQATAPASCTDFCCSQADVKKLEVNANRECDVSGATLSATVNGKPTKTVPVMEPPPNSPTGATIVKITQLGLNLSNANGAEICLTLGTNRAGKGCTTLEDLCVPPAGGPPGVCSAALFSSNNKCCPTTAVNAVRPPPSFCDYDGGLGGNRLPDLATPSHYDIRLMVLFNPLPGEDPSPVPSIAAAGAARRRQMIRKLLPDEDQQGGLVEEGVVGSVNITMALAVATECIVINAVKMEISQVKYTWDGQQWFGEVVVYMKQQVILKFDTPLPATAGGPPGYLSMAFEHPISSSLFGIFNSIYPDAQGKTRKLIATQFEPAHARTAFPCFDEPRLKATFRLTLETPSGLEVISNTEVVSQRYLPSGLTETVFKQTPIMSTYILAFVVGDLAGHNRVCNDSRSTLLGAWATRGKEGQLGVALESACAALTACEAAFGVPYQLPKLDLIAVPYFEAAAMENWGCMLFRDDFMLMEPGTTDLNQELRISSTVTHEIAHQWFGNLVTTAAWEETFLNEGFPSLWEFLGIDEFRRQYGIYRMTYDMMTSAALAADEREYAHALSTRPLERVEDIDRMFSVISYKKGGSVLRMVRAFLNGNLLGNGAVQYLRRRRMQQLSTFNATDYDADPFLIALRKYLVKYGYGSATAEQLWAIFDESTGLPMSSWMHTWTYAPKYPLLQVALVDAEQGPPAGASVIKATTGGLQAVRNLPGPDPDPSEPVRGYLYVTQSSITGKACDDAPGGNTDTRWWIPLNILEQGAPVMSWAPFNSCSAAVPLYKNVSYVLVNPGRYGLYRVNYSEELWHHIAVASTDPQLYSSSDMAGMLRDALLLTAGSPFLDLVKALGARMLPEYEALQIVLEVLPELQKRLDTASLLPDSNTPGTKGNYFKACARNLATFTRDEVIEPLRVNLALGFNFSTDSPKDYREYQLRNLRPIVLAAAAKAKMDAFLADHQDDMLEALKAEQPFSDAKLVLDAIDAGAGGEVLPSEMQEALYAVNGMSGDQLIWNKYQVAYRTATGEKERSLLLLTLARTPRVTLIDACLDMTLQDWMPKNDIPKLLASFVMRGGVAQSRAWSFLFQNVKALAARFSSGASDDDGMSAAGQALFSTILNLAAFVVSEAQADAIKAWAADNAEFVMTKNFGDMIQEIMDANRQWLEGPGKRVCEWLLRRK